MNDDDDMGGSPSNTREHMMDEDFVLLEKKVAEATKALAEANAIAKKKGVTLRSTGYTDEGDDLIDMYGLMAEIRRGGWSTSSMTC